MDTAAFVIDRTPNAAIIVIQLGPGSIPSSGNALEGPIRTAWLAFTRAVMPLARWSLNDRVNDPKKTC